jgi:hypothetical protein
MNPSSPDRYAAGLRRESGPFGLRRQRLGSNSGHVPAAAPQADTQAVLAIARVPSKSSDPLPVGDGYLMLADANGETSDPVPVQ